MSKDILINYLQVISEKGILDAEDADRKENLHRLFMYPAMMVPATQNAILQAISDVVPGNNSSLKFEIMAKQLYVASQRVL